MDLFSIIMGRQLSSGSDSGGESKPQIKCESKVEVIIPVDIYGNVTINNNNISINSTVEIVEE